MESRYTEPKEEVNLGSFLHVPVVLDAVAPTVEKAKRKKTVSNGTKSTAKPRDIRSYFGNTAPAKKRRNEENPRKSGGEMITIDSD